jgi:hypothetical protein
MDGTGAMAPPLKEWKKAVKTTKKAAARPILGRADSGGKFFFWTDFNRSATL